MRIGNFVTRFFMPFIYTAEGPVSSGTPQKVHSKIGPILNSLMWQRGYTLTG